MTEVCPCCGGTGIADDTGEIIELRRECADVGIEIIDGDRVILRDAAALLRVRYGTLRNWAKPKRHPARRRDERPRHLRAQRDRHASQ